MFFRIKLLNDNQMNHLSPKMNLLDDTFPTSYRAPKMDIICKSYDLRMLMY
jgi:hypothetical protein